MHIYLAGENGKWKLVREFNSWGGYDGYVSCRRDNREPLSALAENSKWGGYEYLPGRGTPGEERTGCSHHNWGGQNVKILESFYYCKENEVIPKLLPLLGDFLLDSGAFSFMSGKSAVDWDRYTEEYAEWITRYNITKFFELDIDSLVGLQEVERLRAKLERLTGKQPIPVWHKTRGKDYFLGMAKEYPYVAIGGIVTQEVPRKTYEAAFPWFIQKAHEAGARIHGLGYTSLEGIKKYHFDSVDSTAWLYGNRGGYLYKFNPRSGGFSKIDAPEGHRLASQEAAKWNFREWVKFQRYAEKHL